MMVHLVASGKKDSLLREMKIHFGLARDAHRVSFFPSDPNCAQLVQQINSFILFPFSQDVLFENFEEVPAFPERGQI
jgi:hypothetical protein